VSDPSALHGSTPAELKLRREAEQRGVPFVFFRDGSGALRVLALEGAAQIGRRSACPISLAWDSEVSRAHAELQPVGAEWAIIDDGLSQNGTFVNGSRVAGRRRLRSGDVIRVGRTLIAFWAPPAATADPTVAGAAGPDQELTDAERRVLVALARPLRAPGGVPASNQQIADELFVTVSTVKGHLRSLADKFDLRDVPQTHRRSELVNRAFQAGMLIERDL
jgi:pSer/pThr/pTyr-binding forkhead associated (FHA) protein